VQDPAPEPDVLVEATGTLAQLNLGAESHWRPVLSGTGMLAWLADHLEAGSIDDDILLEAVILSATVCDGSSAGMMAEAGLVHSCPHTRPSYL
jgi:hypothetical protein